MTEAQIQIGGMYFGSPKEENVTKRSSHVIKFANLSQHALPWGSRNRHASSFPSYQILRWGIRNHQLVLPE